MRAAPRFFAVAAMAITIGVCAGFSCTTFDLPKDTCDPSKLHGGMLSGNLSDSTCNRCLEDQCCEEVGICSATPGCTEVVSRVHACVVGHGLQGALDEPGCAAMLGPGSPADAAYRCMRAGCGDECGLPVCKVERSGALIQTAECDACFSSSCCPQLNACYASRACKLTIECIINTCGTMFGDSLTDNAAGAILEGIDSGMGAICDEAGAPIGSPDGGSPVPRCVSACVCTYRGNDKGLPPEDASMAPDRLALDVYLCGQQAECGKHCPIDGGTDEASTEAGPDAGDASSDADADSP